MSPSENDIKPICVPLRYSYQHETAGDSSEDDTGFIGREELVADLINVLIHTRTTRGCYLVAGYRGTGKTSLVNRALHFYRERKCTPQWLKSGLIRKKEYPGLFAKLSMLKSCLCYFFFLFSAKLELNRYRSLRASFAGFIISFIPWLIKRFKNAFRIRRNLVAVRINLGNDQSLKPEHVMYNIAILLNDTFRRNIKLMLLYRFEQFFLLLLITFFISTFTLTYSDFDNQFNTTRNEIARYYTNSAGNQIPLDKLSANMKTNSFYQSILLNTLNSQSNYPTTKLSVYVLILLLLSAIPYFFSTLVLRFFRCWPSRLKVKLANLSMRAKYTHELSTGIKTGYFSFYRKRHAAPLNAVQIEIELLNILEDLRKIPTLLGKPDVVFIFDELDKIRGTVDLSEKTDKDCLEVTSAIKVSSARKAHVEILLSALKNFITTGKARFFFIAGREILDSYQSERGSTSSLYESLFNKMFEVNSLLTDPSDNKKFNLSSLIEAYLCRRLLPPNVATYIWLIDKYAEYSSTTPVHGINSKYTINRTDLLYEPFKLATYYHYLCYSGLEPYKARRIILCLRNFISFLTIHSWGNCKRLNSLFEHFLKPRNFTDSRAEQELNQITYGYKYGHPGSELTDRPRTIKTTHSSSIYRFFIRLFSGEAYQMALQFGLIDQQRVLLSSSLSILLHHHLSRQLSASGDKLVVSTFATLQYILKFHRLPFSRNQMERMDEVINIYRSPDINSMTDTLLSKVLRIHCRRIRNSFYRYRFNSGFEQEIRYISRVSDIESAAFNFSLDSSASVKQYYRDRIDYIHEVRQTDGTEALKESDSIFADNYLALGDLYLSEQSHELAIECYQLAVDTLRPYVLKTVLDKTKKLSINLTGKRLFQYIESLLKLGDSNERRQRYERAAIAYLTAIDLVNSIEDIKQNNDADSSKSLLHELINSPDSKWDIFRQPYWALLYLNLKRSPISWSEKLNNLYNDLEKSYCWIPKQQNKSEEQQNEPHSTLLDMFHNLSRLKQPQIYYRLGKLALFHATSGPNQQNTSLAAKYFSCCIHELEAETVSNERDAFLMGMACDALAEAKLIGLAIQTKSSINESTSFKDIANAFNHLKKASLATPANSVMGLLQQKPISSLYQDILYCENIYHPDLLLKVIALTLTGAKNFERYSLYSQASFSYLSALSVFSILAEQLAILCELHCDLNPTNGASNKFKKKLSAITEWFKKTDSLQKDIRWLCLKNLSYAHGRSYFHFIKNFTELDIRHLNIDPGTKVVNAPFFLKRHYNSLQEHHKKLKLDDKAKTPDMSSLPFFIKKLFDPQDSDTEYFRETAFWEHSLVAQKLAMVSIWHRLIYIRIDKSMNKDGSHEKSPYEGINIENLPPFSVRSLVFGHWLEAMHASDQCITVLSINGAINRTVDYNLAAKAAYNFYRAQHYIRQICGNDQEIMFPPPGLILYHMWRFFHRIYCSEKLNHKSSMNRNSINDELNNNAQTEPLVQTPEENTALTSYQIISHIYENLKLRAGSDVQNCYLDFAFITERTLRYLKDLDSISDLSSRARHEVLKTKYYLGDDYEDSRFNIDWTSLHLFSPIARFLFNHIQTVALEEKITTSSLGETID